MKTEKMLVDWLGLLPQELKHEAVREVILQSGAELLKIEFISFYAALSCSFKWRLSQNGLMYWKNVRDKYSLIYD